MKIPTNIPHFRRFVIDNFPFIENDFDALTDYALISKLIGFLNKVINSQNQLSKDFVELYNYVKDYFDNLDVQEEINNKLDQMAESGQLEQIIGQYIELNTLIVFDTIADMKTGDSYVIGSTVKTLGFYEKGDGGGAEYRIRAVTNEDTVDDTTLFALQNESLVAELIKKSSMNVKQFGCKVYDSENPYDNHDRLTIAVGIGLSELNFTEDEYLITKVTVSNPITIDGKSATCLINNADHEGGIFDFRSTHDCTLRNMTIKTLNHSFNQDGRGVQINSSYNVTIEECTFIDMNGDGIIISKAGITEVDDTHHIYIHNNKFFGKNDSRNGVTVFNGNNIIIENNYFESFTKINMPACIDIEPWLDSEYLFIHDIYIRNNTSIKNKGFFAQLCLAFSTSDTYNVVFENNDVVLDTAGTSGGFSVICLLTEDLPEMKDIVIRGNNIICTDNQNLGIMLEGCENVTIDKNYIKNGLVTIDGSLAFANNLPCDNCYITDNTFVKDANSTVTGSTMISIRMKDDQVMTVLGNKLVYIGSNLDYVTPITFLSSTASPAKINVLSNTVSRTHTTHTESKLCSNYQPTRLGNVGEDISDLNQS